MVLCALVAVRSPECCVLQEPCITTFISTHRRVKVVPLLVFSVGVDVSIGEMLGLVQLQSFVMLGWVSVSYVYTVTTVRYT